MLTRSKQEDSVGSPPRLYGAVEGCWSWMCVERQRAMVNLVGGFDTRSGSLCSFEQTDRPRLVLHVIEQFRTEAQNNVGTTE